MKRDWFSPVLWVPATVGVVSFLVWALMAASNVSSHGATCGSAWHWRSPSATSQDQGGEVSPSARAAQDHGCHQSALSVMNVANHIGEGGAALAFLSAVALAVRERRPVARAS